MHLKKRKKPEPEWENLRLNPEARLCPKFDPDCIAKFPVAERGKMGMRVLDDCAEDNIQ